MNFVKIKFLLYYIYSNSTGIEFICKIKITAKKLSKAYKIHLIFEINLRMSYNTLLNKES